MEKYFEFKCPKCGFGHQNHGTLLPKSERCCPECIREKLKQEGLSKQVVENVMSLVDSCLKTEVEACVDALAHVQNENELTESDVVWIELENAQNALKSRINDGKAS